MFDSTFITYSQNGEDVLLWRALKGVRSGFYIDVGAQDPIKDSVTKAFYERGWRGINVEPIPRWHELLVKDRPHDLNLRVAVSNQSGTIKLFEVEGTGLSTADADFAHRHEAEGYTLREQEVECVTLDQICARNDVETVHFLKVDCEGCEKSVLESFSLSDVRPWIILIEATEPNSTQPTWQQWEHLLTGRGYQFVFFDGLNRFYVADEHKELASAFDAPVNVFDSARSLSEINTQADLDRLRNEIEELRSAVTVAKLREALEAAKAQCDALIIERDSIKVERDTAKADLDIAVVERDSARAERDDLYMRHSALQREDAAWKLELRHLQEKEKALLTSHSWRVTAPLRGSSRAIRWLSRCVRRTIYLIVRPFARAARPVLRWAAQSSMVRLCATAVLGKHSRIVEYARLFLFGANPPASDAAYRPPSQRPRSGAGESFDLDEVMERVRAEIRSRRELKEL